MEQFNLKGDKVAEKVDEIIHSTKTTRMLITIKTKFKELKDKDDDDYTKDIEDTFHRKLYDFIDQQITDNEDMEMVVLDDINDEYPFEFKEFQELGEILISVQQLETTEENEGGHSSQA